MFLEKKVLFCLVYTMIILLIMVNFNNCDKNFLFEYVDIVCQILRPCP